MKNTIQALSSNFEWHKKNAERYIARIRAEREAERIAKLNPKQTQQTQPAKPAKQSNQGWIRDGFVYVPSIDLSFAAQRTHQNINWYDTHKQLAEEKLRMPTPRETWELIFYLKDNLDNPEYEQVYNDILKLTPKDTWHGEWQNAFFTKAGDKTYIQHVKGIKSNGELELSPKKELTDFLNSDCWADISSIANISQDGLCNKQSNLTKYAQGGNIYSWPPFDKSVARFGAGSDWANLYCGRRPDGALTSLGVRACAEGARPKK